MTCLILPLPCREGGRGVRSAGRRGSSTKPAFPTPHLAFLRLPHFALYIFHFSFFISLFISLPAPAQPPDPAVVIRYAAESGGATWKKALNPSENLTARELFRYALSLCEAGLYPERLQTLFEVARRMQDINPESSNYGNFRWYWRDPAVGDRNAVEFCMQAGSLLWLRHRQTIPSAARWTLGTILEDAVQGCLSHNVRESYTNIALMNAQNLILLGESMDRPDVAAEGYARLGGVVRYTWEHGTHEYDSPTYYGVDHECLAAIERFCKSERGRTQARALLELIWTDIALNWFPRAQRLAGAHSRTYDFIQGLGYLDVTLWGVGWMFGNLQGGANAIYPVLGRWLPPDALRTLSRTRFPRLVRQSWGPGVSEAKTHYILEDVTLGSAGANYGAMDMPMTVDLPGNRTDVRCYFVPDARHDPYGKVKVPAGNHTKALHLKPFWRAAQQKRDALGIVIYRDGDLPEEGFETLESHFVLPGDADEVWADGRRLIVSPVSTPHHPLQPGEALVFRKGAAVVGIRVPWTKGLDGSAAPVALIDDGNTYGAARLTVAHHTTARGASAGAAFWVRVGSGIHTDEAFARWRQDFADANAIVETPGDTLRIRVEGQDGPVLVRVVAPYRSGTYLLPTPSSAVLELDGEPLGRRILEKVEPIKSLAEARSETLTVAVPETGGAYWEAERGVVLNPMVVAQDTGASAGRCVWLPGQVGQAAATSELASITWRLRIPLAAAYYVWGRVLAPTPKDDSFYVRAFSNHGEVLARSEWHTGNGPQWEWTCVALDLSKTPTPLVLPQGDVYLQLRAREDGTKIDRLFITRYAVLRPDDGASIEDGAPDFNGDGAINFQDFLLFAAAFGAGSDDPAYHPRFDLDGNGRIAFPDFIAFAAAFGN